MKIENQIILNEKGHTWLGYHSINTKWDFVLKSLLEICEKEEYKTGSYKNAFWVFDKEVTCVAAQPSLEGALKYYNSDRILIHYQKSFI